MKATPKVLFLARWYPDRYDPMKGLFIKRHAEVVAGFADVAVLYLCAAPDKPPGYSIEKSVENAVVTIVVYYSTWKHLPSFISKMVSGFVFVTALVKGYKFIWETWGKPDIVHVNVLTRIGILALWLYKIKDIKYVITEHWSRYLPISGTYRGMLRKILTKFVVGNASAVSTVSQNLAMAMKSYGLHNDHYMVLPNVVDTEVYSHLSYGTEKKIKRFIHISCFEDRSKNISGLLNVISRLTSIRNDFECIMVGEGIDFEKMKAFAKDLGLKSPQVQFTGLLENESLVSVYQSADFMVLFSNYENMPVVISESLSCGLPVVATSVGGIPEYINMNNGKLVAAGDETALLETIIFMLDHFHEYNKTQIRQNAVNTFSKKAVAEKIEELYSFATF